MMFVDDATVYDVIVDAIIDDAIIDDVIVDVAIIDDVCVLMPQLLLMMFVDDCHIPKFAR